MAKTIRKIERQAAPAIAPRRVAAYARVSVPTERLLHSLDEQISYYSALIQNTPGWEYAGVFADRGISGTQSATRDQFQKMLAECEAGNIDIILELRPSWTDKVAVVMTSDNKDPEEWRDIIGNDSRKSELATLFKDNNSPLKIAIVVDMWLTGFDVPSLATMYVFKPMVGHNLMQAIARVNRVFEDKEGGLVVDYIGIAAALKQAMKDFTSRDQKNFGEMDVAKIAYTKFVEKLEVCRDFLHGHDYSAFFGNSDLARAQAITAAVNFIIGLGEEKKKDFIKEAYLLKQSLTLCASLVKYEERVEAAFFEACRVLILRLMSEGGHRHLSLNEINARINELLKQSVKSEGVVSLFSDIKEQFSLFDPELLAEIAKMKEKNIAVEMLKKLLAEQVALYKKNNLVKSQEFSEMLQQVMNSYINGLIDNEQVIQELLDLARRIQEAKQLGNDLGLTEEEQAFYDALTRPEAIKDFYQNKELVALTKELTDALRKNRTIDWEKRDDARAKMRMMVKKLLKRYKYPPEGMEDALKIVMEQCELWTDNATDHKLPRWRNSSTISAFSSTRWVIKFSYRLRRQQTLRNIYIVKGIMVRQKAS